MRHLPLYFNKDKMMKPLAGWSVLIVYTFSSGADENSPQGQNGVWMLEEDEGDKG